mmetsp:Transcript_18273/g.52263  ORF Transcript_18273/g.52263 Transcript_18273/m.52263 type:complete len:207 (-) Transcript_18273:40-660(-)
MFLSSLNRYLIEVGGGSYSGEGAVGQGLLSALGGIDAVGEGELDVALGELHAVDASEVLGAEDGRSDDLDGSGATAVTAGHLVVELGDGPGEGEVAELTVHVVGAGAGVVTEPDAVVLDGAGVLLGDLGAVEDLAGGLLHLAELVQVVPELGLGDDGIGGEDDHPVSLRVGVIIGGHVPADDLVLTHLSRDGHIGKSISSVLKDSI